MIYWFEVIALMLVDSVKIIWSSAKRAIFIRDDLGMLDTNMLNTIGSILEP